MTWFADNTGSAALVLCAHDAASQEIAASVPDDGGPTPTMSHDRIDVRPSTPRNPRLVQLADQIRRRFPRGNRTATRCPSGVATLDAALAGGFLNAAIHELIAPQSGTPTDTLAWHTARHASAPNRWILYLDLHHDLYPPGLAELGVPLERVVIVRPTNASDALWVCEQALRCQTVGAVLWPVKTLAPHASRRLQLAAEAGHSLGLVLCRSEVGGPTFAATRIRCDPWRTSTAQRGMRITILKLREGQPCAPFEVELPNAADFVPAHAAFRHRTGPTRRRVGG